MSHYLLYVVIPGDTPTDHVEEAVANLLEPFSEHATVEPYETNCACVGRKADVETEEVLAELFDVEAIRTNYANLPEDEKTEERWNEFLDPINKKREELVAAHPERNKPIANCQLCEGRGGYITRYNPNSKWDYWTIGGRWDGVLYGPEVEEERDQKRQRELSECLPQEIMEFNFRPVEEIPLEDPRYWPFAILSDKHGWVERGEVCMFGNVLRRKAEEEWGRTVRKILKDHEEDLVVAVDCHI